MLGFRVDGSSFGAGAGGVGTGSWEGLFGVGAAAEFGGGGFVKVRFGDGWAVVGAVVREVAVFVEVDEGVDGEEGGGEPEDAVGGGVSWGKRDGGGWETYKIMIARIAVP